MKICIAGGGTGGHVFPGIAIAQVLKERGHDVFFIGSRGRIEERKVPEYGFEIQFVKGGQVVGVGKWGAIKGLFFAGLGVLEAVWILRRRKADAVVGVGGYASFAAVMATWLRRKPAVICEQNSIPGRTNRFLARFAKTVFTAFEQAEQRLPKQKVELVGNPLRKGFRESFETARLEQKGRRRLLVFGGSQGARTLNNAAMEAVGNWIDRGIEPRMIHQTGSLDYENVKKHYWKLGVEVEAEAFIEDMAGAYAKADIVVARAGAMSISEIAACGLPSVLVPFPYAADNHQQSNAAALVQAGAAVTIADENLDGDALLEKVEILRSEPETMERMARAAKAWDRPDAAQRICDRIEALVGE